MLDHTPVGLDEIIQTFGSLDDPQFKTNNIVLFDLPYPLVFEGQQVRHAQCHKLLVENFQKAFQTVEAQGFENQVKNFAGIFAARPIRGFPSHPSTHSWGIAIDLEAEEFPLGSTKRFPDQIVKIFHDVGFFYGGDFQSRKDPMHFQFAKNY